VADKAGLSASSIIRAATLLGLRALEESPAAAGHIQSGSLTNLSKAEHARIYCDLLKVPKQELQQALGLQADVSPLPKAAITQADIESLRAEFRLELQRLAGQWTAVNASQAKAPQCDGPGSAPAPGVTAPAAKPSKRNPAK